jgi:hypothetical protein
MRLYHILPMVKRSHSVRRLQSCAERHRGTFPAFGLTISAVYGKVAPPRTYRELNRNILLTLRRFDPILVGRTAGCADA